MSSNANVVKLTESVVLTLLRDRHTAAGNGGAGEHAFLSHVRNAAGFDARRTFDAVAVNLWPSRGLTIEVYEIKVSRSDWQRELKKPDKAEDACRIADRFTIVAPAGCVHDGELPPTWGLIEVTGDGGTKPWKLRAKTTAPLLHADPTASKPVPRGLLVGMLRSCPGAVPGGKVLGPAEKALRDARNEGYEQGRRAAEAEAQREADRRAEIRRGEVDDLRRLKEALEEAGAERHEASLWQLARSAPAILAALRSEEAVSRLESVRRTLRHALDALGPDDASTEAQ